MHYMRFVNRLNDRPTGDLNHGTVVESQAMGPRFRHNGEQNSSLRRVVLKPWFLCIFFSHSGSDFTWPVLALKHPPSFALPAPTRLRTCGQSVAQVIAAQSGGRYDIQHVDRPDVTPQRTTDLGVTLILDGRGPGWMAVHLDWQHGPDGTRKQSPSLEMSVMDSALTPQMLDRYAKNLIRADDRHVSAAFRFHDRVKVIRTDHASEDRSCARFVQQRRALIRHAPGGQRFRDDFRRCGCPGQHKHALFNRRRRLVSRLA